MFSFLMSMPIIAAAAMLKVPHVLRDGGRQRAAGRRRARVGGEWVAGDRGLAALRAPSQLRRVRRLSHRARASSSSPLRSLADVREQRRSPPPRVRRRTRQRSRCVGSILPRVELRSTATLDAGRRATCWRRAVRPPGRSSSPNGRRPGADETGAVGVRTLAPASGSTLIERPTDSMARRGAVAPRRIGDRSGARRVRDAIRFGSSGRTTLYVARGKLAGILVEARWRDGAVDWVAIGIGINVRPPRGGAWRRGRSRGDASAWMCCARSCPPARGGRVARARSRRRARGRSRRAIWPLDAAVRAGRREVRGIDAGGELLVDTGSAHRRRARRLSRFRGGRCDSGVRRRQHRDDYRVVRRRRAPRAIGAS